MLKRGQRVGRGGVGLAKGGAPFEGRKKIRRGGTGHYRGTLSNGTS